LADATRWVRLTLTDKLFGVVKVQKWDAIHRTIARFFPEATPPNRSGILILQAESEIVTVVNSVTDCRVNDPDISGSYSGECVVGVAHGKGIAKGRDEYNGAFKNGNDLYVGS